MKRLLFALLFWSRLLYAQPGDHNIYNYSTENGLPTNDYRFVYQDSYGFLWLASYDGLFRWDGYSCKKYSHDEKDPHSLDNDIVYTVFEDSHRRLWVGTLEGLNRYDRAADGFLKCELYHKDGKNPVNAIAEDAHHQLWLGTSNGLCRYDPDDGRPEWFFDKTADDVIFCLAIDAGDNIWTGTFNGRIKKFSQRSRSFTSYNHISGLESAASGEKIRSLVVDHADDIWIGTAANGVIVLNKDGLLQRRYGHFTREGPAAGNSVNCIYEDHSNTIWISTGKESLYYIPAGTTKPLPLYNPLRNNHNFLSITSIREDSFGNIWFGSAGDGLFCTNKNKNVFNNHLQDSSSLSSNYINMVTEDKHGVIWVASEFGGLDRFEEVSGRFTRFSHRYALAESIKALTTGPDDQLWISSNEGIMSFDPRTGNSKRYDATDGLQGNSFYHKAVLNSHNGLLYFGGPRGFTSFDPSDLHPVHLPFYFYYTSLYVYNEVQLPGKKGSPLQNVLSFTDSLRLTHDQSFFSIEFAGINLYAPGKMHYAYQLEGLHDQWIDLKGERKVSFTNLDPGSYVLRIRVADAGGKWYPVDKALHITILPPWWKTWWFRLTMAVICSLTLAGVFYIRVAAIKKRNRFLKAEVTKRTHKLNEANLELQKLNNTKDRFFSILAHDLKDPVSALMGITEFMKENFGKLERALAKDYLNSIHRCSHAVHDLLINLLSWSRAQSGAISCFPTAFSLHELVHECTLLLEQQFDNKNIRLSVDVPVTHGAMADYTMIATVVRNVLSNSIKFTEYNGRVHISSVRNGDVVELSISDNGIGMPADHTHMKKEVLIQMILNFIGFQEKMHDKVRDKVLDTNTLYSEDTGLGKLDAAFLERVVKFISDNISNPDIDAHSVCREMGLSRTVLYSKMKTLTGQSLHEFIKSVRLKQSLKLLLEGEMTISQIAFEVGFNSHSYFDKCFVRQYGIGPKEYVNKKRNYK